MTLTNEKVRVAHISDLEPLIGKKVIVGDTQIGLFLTEEGNIRAINNVCPHKQGPLSEGTVSGDYVYCPFMTKKSTYRLVKFKNQMKDVSQLIL